MKGGKEDDRRQPALRARFRSARTRAQYEARESDRGRDGAEYPPAAHMAATLTWPVVSRAWPSWAFAEPSDGLESSTPSLPWRIRASAARPMSSAPSALSLQHG